MRCSNRHADAAGDMSGFPRKSFAVGFAAVICMTIVGFESTSGGDQRDFAEYGYAEALEEPHSHSSPNDLATETCNAARVATSEQFVAEVHGAAGETTVSQIRGGSAGIFTMAR